MSRQTRPPIRSSLALLPTRSAPRDVVRPELAVGAIAVVDEHLLMIRRATEPGAGLWSLPGGRVESGETLAVAIERELEEETGVVGVCGSLVGWVERISRHHHFVIMDFEVAVTERLTPIAGDDAEAAVWVPVHEVGGLDLVTGLSEFLVEYNVIPAPNGS